MNSRWTDSLHANMWLAPQSYTDYAFYSLYQTIVNTTNKRWARNSFKVLK